MEKIPHVPQAIYMQRALELASHAATLGEVPVGAVIVHKPTNRIIGEGWNLRESGKSPLAHAEIMAINQASRTLDGWRIVDSAIYVTLEPCPMCCGAILHARLDDLIFGAYDPKGGDGGFFHPAQKLTQCLRPQRRCGDVCRIHVFAAIQPSSTDY